MKNTPVKPSHLRKDYSIKIRVTLSQKKMLEKAAAAAMLDLSSWVRIVALAEADRSLRAGKARE
jgi:uncharacterized protein (DUF1778 family)